MSCFRAVLVAGLLASGCNASHRRDALGSGSDAALALDAGRDAPPLPSCDDTGCPVGALPVSAASGCNADRRAWGFTIFREGAPICHATGVVGLFLWVDHELDSIAVRQTFDLESDVAYGLAYDPSGLGADEVTGTITIEAPFTGGGAARIGYDVTTPAGTRYVASNVPVERWCDLVPHCPYP